MNLPGPGYSGPFGGIRVIPSKLAAQQEGVQFRFPRSKKKRIRKKWAKKRENWRLIDAPAGYFLNEHTLICSESFYAQLKEAILRGDCGTPPDLLRVAQELGL